MEYSYAGLPPAMPSPFVTNGRPQGATIPFSIPCRRSFAGGMGVPFPARISRLNECFAVDGMWPVRVLSRSSFARTLCHDYDGKSLIPLNILDHNWWEFQAPPYHGPLRRNTRSQRPRKNPRFGVCRALRNAWQHIGPHEPLSGRYARSEPWLDCNLAGRCSEWLHCKGVLVANIPVQRTPRTSETWLKCRLNLHLTAWNVQFHTWHVYLYKVHFLPYKHGPDILCIPTISGIQCSPHQ